MQRVQMTFTLCLFTALAACGGKSTSSTNPSPDPSNDGGDDTADTTPFDQDSVQTTLAAMPVSDQCSGSDGAATLGELLEYHRQELGMSDTEVTFTCRPQDGAPWDCDWSALNMSEDGESGSGYQILFQVGDDGVIVPDSVHCIAPG